MKAINDASRLAQSASALGAGILGFGIGAKWGMSIGNYAFLIMLVGAIFHVYGMYIVQMKNHTAQTAGIAKALWISAWICLLLLMGLIVYLLIR